MKINMYGGVLASSYNIAKLLRRKGEDVTLFVDKKQGDRSYYPEWEDEELAGGYPEWIKVTDAKFINALMGNRSALNFAKALSDCDALHIHGEAYLWANFFDKPFLFHSYGYDLDQLPFKADSLKAAMLSFFCRRGIRKSARIAASPHQRIFLKKLKMEDKGVFLPYPVDMDKYNGIDGEKLRAVLLASHKADFIFFHPTRHEWKGARFTNNKRNDKVIRAFAAYMSYPQNKAVLVLVNKGRDADESKKLIEKLGITKNVEWLDPMSKSKLIEYYGAADIVFDQFNLGSFGQIFLEAMSCGKPTFIYLKGYEGLYPEPPPAVNVFTTDDILRNIIELTSDRQKLSDTGIRSREWMKRYHNWPGACGRILELYNSIRKCS